MDTNTVSLIHIRGTMKKILDDRCDCDCHKPGVQMKHCMPCCIECPNCNEKIKYTAYDRHLKKCIPLDTETVEVVTEIEDVSYEEEDDG